MAGALRIVSLLASGTELVCALGQGDCLVGRSHECDYPPWVKRLPEVSHPTFDVSGSSRAIDELVRQHLREGKALYTVDEELLVKLAPDVIITQTHCEVCAVSPANLAPGGAPRLVRKEVIALSAGTLDGILEGFGQVARVLDRQEQCDALVSSIRERLGEVQEKTRPLARPRVACLEWVDPLFVMGNWGPEIVELSGGRNVLGAPGVHSTTTVWESLLAADPDVLLIAPCGFDLARTMGEMPAFVAQPSFRDLRATREGRVFVADGNRYFNRSGPSAFESVDVLAEILHPHAFEPRHQGTAWKRWG